MLASLATAGVLVVCGAGGVTASADGPPAITETSDLGIRWYRCTLGGTDCGRMMEEVESLEGGLERSRTELVLRFERQGVVTSATIRTEIDVDATGRPRRMLLEQRLGDEPNITEWLFDDEGVREIRTQGRRRAEARRPTPPGVWHLPGPAFEIARRSATIESPATLRVIDPSRGLDPVDVEYRPAGRETVVVAGGVVDGERWEVREADGTVTVEVVDPQGRTLVSRAPMGAGLGELELVIADRIAADAAARGRVELLDAGLVRPTFEGPIRPLDRGARAMFRLDWPEGVQPPPTVGAQQVDTSAGIVVVVEPGRGTPVEWVDDADRRRHLASTAALDADDPDVVRFARRGAGSRGTTRERAESLRAAVHRHIHRKGMSTAFAGAGETVRTRAGDCTEHAVLLAAALRAVDIPSRTVSGLVWTRHDGADEGAFLWHMWTQAAVDDRWIDLDATLPGRRGFHPGHLAVAVSDGSPRDIESSGRAMLDVFGAVEIDVLSDDREGDG
jgi:transglutaminase-like putative cysteine protease